VPTSPVLVVNGVERQASRGDRNLLSYLRFDLRLTGTKYGCGEGLCGACTVLVDGQPLRSCMTTVGAVAGGEVTTIEGIATHDALAAAAAGEGVATLDDLHPVQRAFVEEQAMQCGYCIPGFIMSTVGLLKREPEPSPAQVREALVEHVCRCGAYQRIERAVLRAAEEMSVRSERNTGSEGDAS